MTAAVLPRFARADVRKIAQEYIDHGWTYEGVDSNDHHRFSHPEAPREAVLPETPGGKFWMRRARDEMARIAGQRRGSFDRQRQRQRRSAAQTRETAERQRARDEYRRIVDAKERAVVDEWRRAAQAKKRQEERELAALIRAADLDAGEQIPCPRLHCAITRPHLITASAINERLQLGFTEAQVDGAVHNPDRVVGDVRVSGRCAVIMHGHIVEHVKYA